MGRSLGFNNIIEQEGKDLRKACINDEPVDRLYATGQPVHSTGKHWSFFDARPKMASGYRLQTKLRPIEAVSRPVDTANFFAKPKWPLATGSKTNYYRLMHCLNRLKLPKFYEKKNIVG